MNKKIDVGGGENLSVLFPGVYTKDSKIHETRR